MKKSSEIKKLSLEERIALCSGKGFWHTKPCVALGIPSVMMADGPHGLRKQEDAGDMLGINRAVPATCFPAASLSACSFDEKLLEEIGSAIAQEAKAHGVSVVLGPGINIKRDPLCGRNFEYFSEDPLVSGKLGAAFIRGVEKNGIGSSVKHFALNSQEYRRFVSDSIVDERTMREIYLRGFEIAIKEGKPSTVMSAYNKINGIPCSSNRFLLTDILRKEWGFDGLVVTDWGAMKNRIHSFEAGCDLCMPGGSAFMEKDSLQAVKAGKLDESLINQSAERVLDLAEKLKIEEKTVVDFEKHHELARWAVSESAVLLKNEGRILPLDVNESVAFIGIMAEKIRYQGTGSSRINPYRLTNILNSAENAAYAKGCNEDGSTDECLIEEAITLAKTKEKVIIFAGLCESAESEGYERENMKMPEGHLKMIEKISEANSNTVVVLMCGSPVEIPWEKSVKAILYAGLSGQAGGEGIIDLLYGKVNPSGKLAESWPLFYEDCVTAPYYLHSKNAHYREGLYVGYRYYSSCNKAVRYPFGYGLSYTEFDYSDLKINDNSVSFKIKNTGSRKGKETAQLYVEAITPGIYRPKLELKGFIKIELQPGETKEVLMPIDDRCFAIYDQDWVIPKGTYILHVGSSSQKLLLSESVEKGDWKKETAVPDWYKTLEGQVSMADFEGLINKSVKEEKLHKGQYTMDNTVLEMREDSLIMKLLCISVEYYIAWGLKCKRDYNNPTFRMMVTQAVDCSLSGMKISAGMNNGVIEGLLEIANGHWIKGIKTMVLGK